MACIIPYLLIWNNISYWFAYRYVWFYCNIMTLILLLENISYIYKGLS